ncbi:hypothetical protein ABG768_015149 [Culter alburnus]|uniref:Uncharacterized protein n=1 Tax=Culter alburnus TaxID=194366 RepID=A0AAW1Z5D9_CULAL
MPVPAESFLHSEGAWAEANYASLDPARFIGNTNTYMTVDKHVAPFSESAKQQSLRKGPRRDQLSGLLGQLWAPHLHHTPSITRFSPPPPQSPITYVPISRPEVDGVLVFVPCF